MNVRVTIFCFRPCCTSFRKKIQSDVVLFADHHETSFTIPQITFCSRKDDDEIFKYEWEPVGPYVLERIEKL